MNKNVQKGYFQRQEKGYQRYLNQDKVWVIRADAKDTASKKLDLTVDNPFSKQIIKTSIALSQKYLVYSQSDEINFFITKPEDKEVNTYSKVLSYYSQLIYSIFNSGYQDQTFFCVKLFTLEQIQQIRKYIAYRKIFARNFYLTHAVIKANVPYLHMSNQEKKYFLIKNRLLTNNVYLKEGSIFLNGKQYQSYKMIDISSQGVFDIDEF